MVCNIRRNGIFFAVGCLEISHLIKAVIEENNLALLAVGTSLDQDVARMGVTMNKSMDKDHLTVQLSQVL